ncbi:MAG TPA: glycerol kinase GlpK [Acidobacteriota bacterium]|nr:glycerol kinase GlpK [Acidobacteriota bacterium]
MGNVLALDQGTTSSRAVVFDVDGNALGQAQREFGQIFPRPGWVEHDASEIWQTQLAVARDALTAAGLVAGDITAIGITNQRETTVLWDRNTGAPIHNAIVWQDRRTAERCDELRRGPTSSLFRERTGLQIDPYFSGTKVAWLLEHVDGARERAESGELAFGTVDSWLLWNLTAGRVHATDASNASRTLLFDIHDQAWHPELLAALGVPAAVLPTVCDSSKVYGETEPDLFGGAIPVAGIAGDQQAALFGQMCVRPGMAKNTYGTGCFLLMNTGPEAVASDNGLLTTVAWRLDGQPTYALEGSVFIGGAAVQWLRDGLGLIDSAADVEALANRVDDSGGVYCVPAFTGLGAPHWDAYARGAVLGITRGTSAAHLARATLEGIAHQVADVLEAMVADSGVQIPELRVDGGAAANQLLLQVQADLIGARVVRPRQLESTALGAAYLAGLATGVWDNIDELASRWGIDTRFDPQLAREDVASMRSGWSKAVQRSQGWAREES